MFAQKYFALLAFAAVAVHAQDLSGVDECIIDCVTSAASSNGCSSFTDLSCVCSNTQFQQASLSCLQSKCTQDDVNNAMQLQQAQCGSTGSASASEYQQRR
ncbi:hypothetical protein K435DRAFT_223018 [Dendrothele bispora CBS 962.96]|uniref:CFEM domain-containing protein n=1 Tax=Dendrothele bispora (strain CBS 962.96) TaxID=1314807 RepID=A0A4S8LRC6_DENBC|nr:hypothetical protein K435DRAFT_223018 [Dendrothele bispora CBS 962.96]